MDIYNMEHYLDTTAYQAIKNSEIGRRSKEAGQAFEDAIIEACEIYERQHIAKIEKTPEPIRQIGKMNAEGTFKACYIKQAQPDFKGTVKGGRAVVFEAKHTDKSLIQQSAVTEWQWKSLDQHEELGAWCFVLVSILHGGVFRVPWADWKNFKGLYGHKYATADELAGYRVQINRFLEREEKK
jgi:recombination protein U